MKMKMNINSAHHLALLSLLLAFGARADQCDTKRTAREAVACLQEQIASISAKQSLIQTSIPLISQKLCRAVWGDHFSDGVVVPREWTIDNCIAYAAKTGGPTVVLGCVYPNSVVFGIPGSSNVAGGPPGLPTPNCGW